MKIGEYIRAKRRALDITQDDLIDRLKQRGYTYSKSQLSNWETGRNDPPMADTAFVHVLVEALEDEPLHFLAETGYLGDNDLAKLFKLSTPQTRDLIREFFRLTETEIEGE